MRTRSNTVPSVGFVSLGCPKALVDTEKLVTRLRVEGYEVASDYPSADLVVVNTCAFIDAAVAESLDAIAEAMKENGRVLVIGCLGGKKAQDGGNWLLERFPDLIGVVGPDQVEKAMALIRKALPAHLHRNADLDTPAGIKLTPSHYAYLKISEGCSHKCTFCIIPDLRGPLVSRPIGDVMREAESLVTSGVRELLVISQDTAAYGLDVHYKTGFVGTRPVKTRFLDLAEELSRLDCWVRFHYVYPYPSVDAVLPLMAEGKILPYLDVPFQHAHPRILKAMKRPASAEKNLDRIRAWRSICPDVAIRSTFIVGFPGETEPAKWELRWRCMQGRAEISSDNLQKRVGRIESVLIDTGNEGSGRAVGRSQYEAPDIDGVIYVNSNKPLYSGDIVQVRLTAATEHDLNGVAL